MRLWRKKQLIHPIWIKDHNTGLYERIPYDKMIQFPNGNWGYRWGVTQGVKSYGVKSYTDDEHMLDFISCHSDHFEYQPGTDIWVFLPAGKNHEASPWVRAIAASLLAANTMVLLTLLYQHDYSWSCLQAACIGLLLFTQYKFSKDSRKQK